MPEENCLYQARLHWIIFIWPIILFGLMSYLSISDLSLHTLSNFGSVFAILWFANTALTYCYSSLTIETKQVVLRTGFLMRQSINVPLSKIESIDIRQSIVGSLFRYGSLVITGTGGTRQSINYIDKPLTCRRYIEQAMNNL